MRRILMFTRFGISAISSTVRRASACLLTAGLIVSVGAAQSQAQYPVAYAASSPTATGAMVSGQANGGSYFGSSVMRLGDAPASSGPQSAVVDSAFRGSTNSSSVKTASYIGNQGLFALRNAEQSACYGPGAACDISWYFSGEALFFRREGDRRFSLTQNVFMDNYDYEFGGRFTVGKMMDCVNAYEFVYAGPIRWTRTSDVQGAGTINSRFVATPGTLDDAFNGANRHTQVLQNDLNSFELNRRWWAWDAISTLIGIRYLKYEEDYLLNSFRPAAPTSGSYRDSIDNDLVGLQVGGDVFFPTSLRTSISLKGKAGVYANFGSRVLRLQASDGTSVINGFDDVDIAGVIEIGANGHYQLTPSIRLTGGYEAWFLPGMATASSQLPQFLSGNSGTSIRYEDDIVFHGLAFGAQVLY